MVRPYQPHPETRDSPSGSPGGRPTPTGVAAGCDDSWSPASIDAPPRGRIGLDDGMTAPTARRVAWSVGTLSILLMIGALVFLFVDRHAKLPSDAARWSVSTILGEITNIAVPVIGVVLASRRRQNPL